MTSARRSIPLICALALAFFATAVAARAATLGRGLAQLTSLYESGNPKLTAALKIHIVSADGLVMVHVRIDAAASAAQTLSRLVAAGLRVTAVSEMDPTLIEGYLPLGATRAAAAVPGVLRVLAVQRPRNLAGSVQSQAVAVQKADLAQARGVDGTGTRVGVLSDSFASVTAHPNAADDVASGDLPSGIVVLPGQDLPPGAGEDEGRAMLQLVHDVAPGATLGFERLHRRGPVLQQHPQPAPQLPRRRDRGRCDLLRRADVL